MDIPTAVATNPHISDSDVSFTTWSELNAPPATGTDNKYGTNGSSGSTSPLFLNRIWTISNDTADNYEIRVKVTENGYNVNGNPDRGNIRASVKASGGTTQLSIADIRNSDVTTYVSSDVGGGFTINANDSKTVEWVITQSSSRWTAFLQYRKKTTTNTGTWSSLDKENGIGGNFFNNV